MLVIIKVQNLIAAITAVYVIESQERVSIVIVAAACADYTVDGELRVSVEVEVEE